MSTLVWVGAGWLVLAVLAFSWLAAARRGDRSRTERPPAMKHSAPLRR
jgi:hypothetical protein